VERGLGFGRGAIGRLQRSRARAGVPARKKVKLTGWTTTSDGEREEARTSSVNARVGRWPKQRPSRMASPSAFSYFFISFSFLFWFSELFLIFCKNAPNPFKPLSEIF
jgi:hypothetical protein